MDIEEILMRFVTTMCQSYGSRQIEIQLSKENEYVISLGICKLFVTAKYGKYTARTTGNNSVTSSNSEQLEQQSESKPIRH